MARYLLENGTDAYLLEDASGVLLNEVSELSVGLINQTATTSAPTVTSTRNLTIGLLSNTAATFTPTVSVGAAPITLGLINRTAATFTPTVTPGAVNITLGLLNPLGTFQSDTFQSDAFETAGSRAFTPTVSVGAAPITLGLINRTAATFTPTVTARYDVGLGPIAIGHQTGDLSGLGLGQLQVESVLELGFRGGSRRYAVRLFWDTQGVTYATNHVGLILIRLDEIADESAVLGSLDLGLDADGGLWWLEGKVSGDPDSAVLEARAWPDGDPAGSWAIASPHDCPLITRNDDTSSQNFANPYPIFGHYPSGPDAFVAGAVTFTPTITVGAGAVSLGLINQTASTFTPSVTGAVDVSLRRISAYEATVLADGPVSYYRFGEPLAGGDHPAYPVVGPAATYHAVTGGQASLIAGDSDPSVDFNGDESYVSQDSNLTVFDGTHAWSFEIWISGHTPNVNYARVFEKRQTVGSAYMAFISNNAVLMLSRSDGTGTDELYVTPIASAGIHHLVATYDGSNQRIYLDGVEQAAIFGSGNASTRSLPALDRNLAIAAHPDVVALFAGTLDEPAIYDYALSGVQVANHYSVGTVAYGPRAFQPSVASVASYAPALINQTAATFAPTVTPGAAPVSVGLIDRTAATFTPTVIPGAVNVSVALISQAATTFTPTITKLNTISVALINQSASTFTPSISRAFSVALINQTAATFTPSVTPGAVNVSLALLNATAATFAPTVTPGAAPVTIGLLSNPASTFTPTISSLATISVALISQPATTFAPTVTTTYSVVLGRIDRTAATFTPTITTGAVNVSLALISQPATTFAPTVSSLATISVALINQTATPSAPVVIEQQFVVLGLLAQTAATFTPTITTLVTVSLAPIDRTAATFAPTITPGAVNISLARTDQTAVAYDPDITSAGVIALDFIDQTAVAYAPSVTSPGVTQDYAPALINQTATTFAPTISSLATISFARINQTAQTLAPALTPSIEITLSRTEQPAQAFAPTVTTGVVFVLLGQIDSSAVAFEPTVEIGSLLREILLGLISQPATAFAPSIAGPPTGEGAEIIIITGSPAAREREAKTQTMAAKAELQYLRFTPIDASPRLFEPEVEADDELVRLGLDDESLIFG